MQRGLVNDIAIFHVHLAKCWLGQPRRRPLLIFHKVDGIFGHCWSVALGVERDLPSDSHISRHFYQPLCTIAAGKVYTALRWWPFQMPQLHKSPSGAIKTCLMPSCLESKLLASSSTIWNDSEEAPLRDLRSHVEIVESQVWESNQVRELRLTCQYATFVHWSALVALPAIRLSWWYTGS